MSLKFNSFKIDGFQGNRHIEVNIDNNTLIVVGENGSGKTTFLRMLFYFLSGKWNSLSQFQFSCITAEIGGKKFTVEKSTIESAAPYLDAGPFRRLPPSLHRHYRELLELGRTDEAEGLLSGALHRFNLPKRSEQKELDFENSATALDALKEALSQKLGAQILYLPTFRRIERELSSIVRGYDPDDSRRLPPIQRQQEDANDYIELVEFGMNDVRKAIDKTLNEIRSFQLQGITRLSLSYLGDVVSQDYLNIDQRILLKTPAENIDSVLNRVDNSILSKGNKDHLREIISSRKIEEDLSEHEKIIYHYFAKLLKFQEDLENREKNIRSFCELCSVYITDKKFIYESSKYSFRIEHKYGDVEISDLSSGEKQIVSLFSHLYLSGRDKFFVLIDEPELSLSVPWQRRFLVDIRDASFCSGLVAVTHSPFIYDNKLRSSTHALGEFVRGPDWGNIQ